MPDLKSKPVLGSRTPEGTFQFFQPRFIDHFFEGRDPHDSLKFGSYARLFPQEIHLTVFFFAASLALFLSTLSTTPFPGLPVQTLLAVLPGDPIPPVLNPIWAQIIRFADAHLPAAVPISLFASLFAAFFGALSVALLATLLMNVGYIIRNEPGPANFFFEAYARRLSAACGALFLAVCPPFWYAATRSLPHTFHVFLMLLAARIFTRYQHEGRKLDLALLALVWGVGLAESSAFLVMFPFFLCLSLREIYRWQALRSWTVQLAFWGCLLLGASLVVPEGLLLVRRGRLLDLYPSLGSALFAMLSAEGGELLALRNSLGVFVLAAYLVIPWVSAFLLSRRSPWFFEDPQTFVHLLYAAALFCIALNLSFSPWKLMFTFPLVVLPYVVIAGTFGYVVGALFIHGDFNPLVRVPFRTKCMRFFAFGISLAMPLLLVGAGALDVPVLNARAASFIQDAADSVLDSKSPEQTVFFSTGLLDDAVRVRAHERRNPLVVVSLNRSGSPKYLRGIAMRFPQGELRDTLAGGDLEGFVRALGNEHIGIIDYIDYFRQIGVVVPSTFSYALEGDFKAIDWSALARDQLPALDALAALKKRPLHPDNPLDAFRKAFLRLAAKNLNNLAMYLFEVDKPREAFDLLMKVHDIDPENISVLFNLASCAADFRLPRGFDPEEELLRQSATAHGALWNLSVAYGYVRDARSWVRKNHVWALSGDPTPPLDPNKVVYIDPNEDALFVQWLEIAFNRYGTPLPKETDCRARLLRNERDGSALLDLAFLALRHKDSEIANAYLAEALDCGVDEDELALYRAVILYLDGDLQGALKIVRDAASYDAKAGEPWTFLLLLSEEMGEKHDFERARKTIDLIRPGTVGLHLAMARWHMNHEDWANAQKSIEAAAQLDPSVAFIWEMLGEVASKTGDTPLLRTAYRALQERNPDHYLKYLDEGLAAFRMGNLAKAEDLFRKGISFQRAPALLNNTAHIILLRGGDLETALNLVNEAIQRNPLEYAFLSTRASILAAMQRYDEAAADYERLRDLGKLDENRIVPCVETLLAAGRIDEAKETAFQYLQDTPQAPAPVKTALRKALAPHLKH